MALAPMRVNNWLIPGSILLLIGKNVSLCIPMLSIIPGTFQGSIYVNFITALIDTINAHYPIDLNRGYATGMSMGGISMMQ